MTLSNDEISIEFFMFIYIFFFLPYGKPWAKYVALKQILSCCDDEGCVVVATQIDPADRTHIESLSKLKNKKAIFVYLHFLKSSCIQLTVDKNRLNLNTRWIAVTQ